MAGGRAARRASRRSDRRLVDRLCDSVRAPKRKDAYDIALMLGNYLETGNRARFCEHHADLLDADQFDYVQAGFELVADA